MFQNIAITFAIIIAIVVSLKAIIDVKNANKALDEADESDQAPYKVETPMEEYPVEEVIEPVSAPAEPIPSLQEPISKPKRRRRKKAPAST